MQGNTLQAAAAELMGTFLLVFFGCGTILIDQDLGGIFGLQGIAFTFGLIVIAIIYALGHVSGAHINPAVTIALACTKKFSWHRVPAYIGAQMVGAIVAALLLNYTLAHGDSLAMTLPSGDLLQAFLLEMAMTAFLMFVVMGVGTDTRAPSQFTAIAVGAVIVVDILIGGTTTGASMNPARSLGPALIKMNFDHIWLYLLAPVVGALVGAYAYIFCTKN